MYSNQMKQERVCTWNPYKLLFTKWPTKVQAKMVILTQTAFRDYRYYCPYQLGTYLPNITKDRPDMFVLCSCNLWRKQPIRRARPKIGITLSFRSQFLASMKVRLGVFWKRKIKN